MHIVRVLNEYTYGEAFVELVEALPESIMRMALGGNLRDLFRQHTPWPVILDALHAVLAPGDGTPECRYRLHNASQYRGETSRQYLRRLEALHDAAYPSDDALIQPLLIHRFIEGLADHDESQHWRITIRRQYRHTIQALCQLRLNPDAPF